MGWGGGEGNWKDDVIVQLVIFPPHLWWDIGFCSFALIPGALSLSNYLIFSSISRMGYDISTACQFTTITTTSQEPDSTPPHPPQ